MMFRTIAVISGLSMPGTLLATALLAGDAANGKALHDKACIGCHDNMTGGKPDMLYTRSDRRVSSIGGLMAQVGRCNKMQGIGMSDREVDDVVRYLNEAFYRFSD